MYVSFGRRLRTLGRVRIGAGFRVRGATGLFLLMFVAIFRLMWYIMLGVLWMMYGIIYLCFILPIRGIVRLCKRRKTR